MFLGSFLFKEKYMPRFIFTVDLTDYLEKKDEKERR